MQTVVPTPYSSDPFFAVPTMTRTTSEGDVELPILYYDNSNVFALFRADPDAVKVKLAGTGLRPAIHLGKGPVVAVALYEYRLTSIGPYNEVGVGILVEPEELKKRPPLLGWTQLLRSPDRRDQGAYILDLPVTTEAAFAAGSQIWGYPKFVAPISFQLGGGRFSSVTSDPSDGSTIMELSGRAIPTFKTPPMPLVLYSHLDGVMLRTNVDLRNGLRAHVPGGLKLTVGSSSHRMANNLRDLGLDGARPFAVASTDQFQSRLNAGVPFSAAN